ncbi:MAG TPA: hypothetical protein VFB62_02525 [Polyangiaceae bacterium]|jgi:hypothetical protein|nr:hypothetical protein [Polyangiaceae bacterium]
MRLCAVLFLVSCQPAATPLDALASLRTIEVAEDAPAPARVTVFMARGRLKLAPGGTHTVSGTVRTNLPAFEPVVERTRVGLEIAQRTRDLERDWPRGARGEWRLALDKTASDLTLLVHTVETELDLGGLSLRSLRVRGDAGAVMIDWSRRNTRSMTLDIATYVGPIALRQLGRSGASKVHIRNMVGPIDIDFGPRIANDVEVRIEGMTSPVRVIVPKSTSARAFVNSDMGIVEAPGWIGEGKERRIGSGRPSVTLHIRVAQGPVELAVGK